MPPCMFPKFRKDIVVILAFCVNLLVLVSFTYQGMFVSSFFKNWILEVLETKAINIGYSESKTSIDFKQVRVNIIQNYLNASKADGHFHILSQSIESYHRVNCNICSEADKVDVLVLVHSAPKNLEKRQRMRDTFAKKTSFLPFQVRIAFLLGLSTNLTLQRVMEVEHERHNDTVIGNFIDDYHNLTLKGVMGFKWVSEHCANSRFILKIDDDVIINMYKFLYSFLNHMSGKTKSIFCNLWVKNSMQINRKGKWKVEPSLFHHKMFYPFDYCSGFVVVMTSDLMNSLYQAAKSTPYFWIDDVYLFGMLPSVVGGVTYYDYSLDTNITLNTKKAMRCTKELGPKCPIFASGVRNHHFWPYWRLIQAIYATEPWVVVRKRVS